MSSDNFLGFDPTNVSPIESLGERERLPDGQYKVTVNIFTKTPTRDNSGVYWYTEFVVAGGEHDGKVIVMRFNVINKNIDAERIGRGQLKRLLNVVGGEDWTPRQPEELLGRVLVATVKNKKGKPYERNGEQITPVNTDVVRMDSVANSAKSIPAASLASNDVCDVPPWG